MAATDAVQERHEFAKRLHRSMRQAGHIVLSPTVLVRQFNACYSGKPVSVHAVRKWLLGETIPTQEKLRVLAQSLNVPVEWLRFGEEAAPATRHPDAHRSGQFSRMDVTILESIKQLDDVHQEIVLTLIKSLIKAAAPASRQQ